MDHKHELRPAIGGGVVCNCIRCDFRMNEYETAEAMIDFWEGCKVALPFMENMARRRLSPNIRAYPIQMIRARFLRNSCGGDL